MVDKAEVVKEARERLKEVLKWESLARQRAKEDYRFANGDPDNGYQWPAEMQRAREIDSRPCLTVNKVRQHVLQIINDARQHKTSIKVNPVGDGATYESAQLMQSLVEHIEYQSQAHSVYIQGAEHMVTSGIGYWRVLTDYVSDTSFDQEIYVKRIKDPGMVALDPDINEKDGSDARYGFIFEDLPDDVFAKRYPKYKDKGSEETLGIGRDTSVPENHVRICEYFRREEKKDVLYAIDGKNVKKSKIGATIAKELDDDDTVQKRDILTHKVDWFFIVGDLIVDQREWPGTLIPIVRAVSDETTIDGRLDRKGHVRSLKDPQRMYNYWTSAAVEFGALQTKIPYTVALESTEGVEKYWETANTVNHSYLPYKALSDAGMALPPPQRIQPPQAAEAFLQGMQTAANELMFASGQYQAMMGQQGNEVSGVAINSRQRQGDNSTYHYIDELANAIRYTGRIILELIPKIYDTERVVQIVQESGAESSITIQPNAQGQASQQAQDGDDIKAILNPSVGTYQVQSDVGPAFATRRQEAFDSMMKLSQASPDFFAKAGDLVMRAADFPMADELAERLKPPDVDPQMAQMQQTIQTLMEDLSKHQGRLQATEQQKGIDVYKAETERMKVVSAVDPAALAPIIQQLVQDAIRTHMGSIMSESQQVAQQHTAPAPIAGQNQGAIQ